jgi:uncharacterized protein YceH (UPF0502 family)
VDLKLTLNETRVLGSLLEKEVTTPEQYPLSLNALILSCNQKSNREPVLALNEATVRATLEQLTVKRLVMEKSGFGSRVPKYQHRFGNTEFSEYSFDRRELALLCVLFLRGAQTPGELRSRTHRLCDFGDGGDVDAALRQLMERADGPFVAKLPREPGRRESRYVHLFSAEPAPSAPAEPTGGASATLEKDGRIAVLERRVDELAEEVERLKLRLACIEDTGAE